MRKHLVFGALLVGSLVVANVHGGIFNRGGGCPNGQCGRGGYSGGYSGGYYSTNVVKAPAVAAQATQPAAPAQERVAAAPATETPAAPQATVTTTRASNGSTASSPRGRFFRRWSR